jgi:hypothetical protein
MQHRVKKGEDMLSAVVNYRRPTLEQPCSLQAATTISELMGVRHHQPCHGSNWLQAADFC